ncbi:hypothetical protein scyTo_0004815, partial [Scyliorhinus torazame]|nr:hypothetical protein [Scyliorhinus torazame]
ICVAQPYDLVVQKDFFIDLRLPYSVIRNEQVEIRAILYNYEEDPIKVRVEFPYNENLCSRAKQTQRFRQQVTVPGKGSVAVPYVIVPLIIGEIDIEVKASVYDKLVTDGVRKPLLVVPEGKKIDRVKTYNLDPKGDILAQTIENTIDGAKLKHLIRAPGGCGEQNMASITPVVIVTNFLDKTQQWENVGLNRRNTALNNIQQGYVQQLAYRKPDNSYAAFMSRPSSTWLTAYVLKVFAMSYNLITIQADILCGAAKWLILNKQKPDGHFQEDAPVMSTVMIGGVHGSESDTSLTAFVLIAMLEAKYICSIYIENYDISIRKAADYVQNRIGNLKRTYSVTIATYALSLLRINKLDNLMKFASETLLGESYWAEAGNVNSLYTIEATGYALLALVQFENFDQAGKAVKWLSQRSEYGGGYSSTQATMVALQGLANYQAGAPPIEEIDLDVVVTIPGRRKPIKWSFDLSNRYVAKSTRMSGLDNVVITATGKGQGTMKVLTSYHALLEKHAGKCQNLNLEVTVEEVPQALRPQDAQNSLMINICTRYLGDSDSSMIIVDITMLTGFSPDTQDLDLLNNEVDGYISRYELDKALSAKGSLIIYLDSVSHTEDTCLGFKVHQFFKVGLIQPASVKVYEYYDTENSCTKFYNVNANSGMLSKICEGDVCRCAEGSCITVKMPELRVQVDQREEKACDPQTDYVYKVLFQKKKIIDSYIYYEMKILSVIKQESPMENREPLRDVTEGGDIVTEDVQFSFHFNDGVAQ